MNYQQCFPTESFQSSSSRQKGESTPVVVQIPVDVSGLTAAMYSNGRNLHEGDSAVKRKKPVLGCECEIDMLINSKNADMLPVFIQALSTAGCCRTRMLSG